MSVSSRTARVCGGSRSPLTGKDSHTWFHADAQAPQMPGSGWHGLPELVHEVAMDYQPDAVGRDRPCRSISELAQRSFPARWVFTIDIRSPDQDVLDEMRARIEQGIETDRRGRWISATKVEPVGHFDPVTFDEGLRESRPRTRQSGSATRHRDLVSGAGHRRVLDQPCRADRDGHVPLRRWSQPQRGRRDHQGLGTRRGRRAVSRGRGDGGDR